MQRDPVTTDQMAYFNMLTLNALVDLLDKKGTLNRAEVLQRVKELQREINFHLEPE